MSVAKNWLDSEPVRTRIYPLLVAAVGYLAIKGVIDGDTLSLILAVAGALFGVPLTEGARNRVWIGPPTGRHAAGFVDEE